MHDTSMATEQTQIEPSPSRQTLQDPNKAGVVFGALIGGWHVLWALLVLFGWAQPIIDFIFWAHMMRSIYIVKAFDPLAALVLIVITLAIGYVFGHVGTVIWNKLHR